MKRNIIFLDIDGTLTEPGKNQPPESAIEAVARARERGHLVFLCSGRNYNMLSPLLKYEFDGVIASAGGYIECKEHVIYDCPMTEELRTLSMGTLKEYGIFRTIECMDGSYTDDEFKDFLKTLDGKGGNSELLRWREQLEKSLNILSMKEYEGQPVYKITFMSPSLELLSKPRKILEPYFNFCIQDNSKGGFVNGEMINRQFDKGRAIERVCQYLQIPLEDSVAVGDSMNDKEMLKTAGLGLCMENGSQELKKIADDICPPVGEDGIKKAFLKYDLI